MNALAGVRLEPSAWQEDVRGTFSKLFDKGDDRPILATQVCISTNLRAGTVRGLHLQVAPHLEAKSLWCSQGQLFDVLVDLRPEQPTYGDWAGVRLDADDPRLLHVPSGVAHGFQTLLDHTSVTYLIAGEHHPESARTLLWNDPTVQVSWPMAPTVMSQSDREGSAWPLS